MSIEIKRSDKYVDYNISATNNRGYITIDTSDWINKPWMFYELPALKFEIYTETNGELVKYKNFTREIRTYNPVYSPLGVLNVTIDIRNVPEEFILRITPIFDNDAISARNMLIENGIENGDIWGSDQGVPTQLFNLDLEFIECEGEYVPPTPPVPPTHEETITGIPPITFDGSTGEPLVSWTILGNGQQTGTPSPDNIIMPTFCGVRTGNLWDEDYAGISGSLKYVPVFVGDGTFTLSTDTPDYLRNAPLFLLSGNVTSGASTPTNGVYNGISRTTDSSNGYITIAFRLQSEESNPVTHKTMLNSGNTALPYEPYGYKITITCAGQTTPVYLGQTQTVRRIRKLVLDGTENWRLLNRIASVGGKYFSIAIATQERTEFGKMLCSHYTVANPYDRLTACCVLANYSQGIDVRVNNPSTDENIDDFKSYLADQYAAGTPVTIWYVLAEPETAIVNEPLAKIGTYADELHSTDAGVTIPTTEGQNTLTVDTDLQPSEMTITYIKEGQ